MEGAFQVGIMRKIMERLPGFFDRVPDQSLILSPAVSVDSLLGDKLVSGMRSTTWLAAHLPHGGEVEVRLDASVVSDRWRAAWLDPKTGAREVFQRGSGEASLIARSPSEGSIDKDWILFVERDELPGLST